ncbi:MAG: adenosylcobinamide-GDP ribazoletransferase [Paracoccaceae bacterium]
MENQNENTPALFDPRDISRALGLLSRLPVRPDGLRGAQSVWAFPIVGLIIALIVGFGAALGLALGLAPALAAGLALGLQIMITGAMHEDGLADTFDGLWGGWEAERRLEIMKDSRIGAYGVIALNLSLILRWAALWALFSQGAVFAPLVAAAMLSRAPMVVLMAVMASARSKGLAASQGRPTRQAALLACGIGLFGGLLCAGLGAGIVAAALCALAAAGLGAIAQAKIGGQTGDILGASQQICEIVALSVLASMV